MKKNKQNKKPNKATKKDNAKKYYVQGMHCSTCKVLIKQDLENIKGITNANVSLKDSQVVINASDSAAIPSVNNLNQMFSELGYTFYDKKIEQPKLTKKDAIKISLIAVLFIVSFYFLEDSGFFMQYSLSANSSLLSYFVFGLAAGVSSCAALVGGLLLSLSKNWNNLYGNNKKQSYTPFVYFNVSRIITFAFFGGVLGYLGSVFSMSVTMTSILTLMVSLLMIVLGLQMIGVTWFNRFSFNFLQNNKYLDKNNVVLTKYVPIIVGALTFFVPCGFTIIAQANTLTAGSLGRGVLQLTAFSLGTLPILALISFTSVRFYSNPKFSSKFSLFSGVVIIFFALYTLNSQLNVLGFKSLSDINLKSTKIEKDIAVVYNQGYQLLELEATGFEYLPRQVTIKSGIKTKLIINDTGSVGCAKALYARGLYPNVIQLKPGINTYEFIAPKPGNYKISCSMGMVAPVNVKVL